MRFDSKPVHRRILVPWYDSNGACYATIFMMLPSFLFALVGIWTAGTRVEWHGLLWLPILLALAAGSILFRNVSRLVHRKRGE